MESKKESALKKSWLKRLAKLKIDNNSSKHNSSGTSEEIQNSDALDKSSSRSRAGVFRSLRRMHFRVKSCVSKQKLRDAPPRSQSEMVSLDQVPDLPPRNIPRSNSFTGNAFRETSERLEIDVGVLDIRPTCPSVSSSENINFADEIFSSPSSSADVELEEISGTPLSKEIANLATCCWYWGPLPRKEAESKLCNLPDGAFLLRDTSSEVHLFSLSFRSIGNTFHTLIEHDGGGYSLYSQNKFPTIADLINNAMAVSKNSVFCYSKYRNDIIPMFPVRLIHPVSRFTQVRSLQYLCRFVIRQYISINNISNLPIPVSLQSYLSQGHY